MSRHRLWVVYVLLAFLVGGHLFDAAFAQEHWPFSNYPMFARTATSPLRQYVLTCLTSDAGGVEREMILDWRCVPSLPPYKFDGQLRHYAAGSQPDPKKLQRMLGDYIAAYDARRKLGLHHGPVIHGLRLYKVDIPLEIPPRPETVVDGHPEQAVLVMEFNNNDIAARR
jgi:hypothetical protein